MYFIADEFSLLPNLKHIDGAVNFGRCRGINFLIGFQNIGQIVDNNVEWCANILLFGF